MDKEELVKLLEDALIANGGSGNIVQLCRWVWEHQIQHLSKNDNLFYTWQYDIRWAATKLRRMGIIKDVQQSAMGVWELTK